MTSISIAENGIAIAGSLTMEGCITKPSKVIIGPVAILPDGSIERTDAFTTNDAAALEFWKAVENLFGRMDAARARLLEAYCSGLETGRQRHPL